MFGPDAVFVPIHYVVVSKGRVRSSCLSPVIRWATPAISGQHGEGWLPPATKPRDLAVAGTAVFERIRSAGRLVASQFSPYAVVILPSHSPPAGTDAC
jgi:hypothetical protein